MERSRSGGTPATRRWSAAVLVVAASVTLASCSTLQKLGGKPVSTQTAAVIAPETAPSSSGAPDGGAPSGGQDKLAVVAAPTSSGPSATTAPATAPAVSIQPGSGAAVSPITPIVVTAANGSLTSVLVSNGNGVGLTGHFNAAKTTWTSTQQLAYGKKYSVSATAASPSGQTTSTSSTVTTVNPKVQAYPSVVPPPTTTSIGVGLPLAVRFDQPITDHKAAQDALSVTTNPQQEGAWYWIDDREVHYRPAVYWRPGTQITLNINVFGVDLGGGIYGQTNRTVTYTVHDSWIAKADGATETMLIYHNEKLVNTMPISMGKDATPTHIGTHVVSSKAEKYVMNSCSYGVCSGPHAYVATEYWAVRISNDGEFVHENPKSVGAQGNTNVSNGCINLNEANAKWFYAHFDIGDVVEVNNSGGGTLPIYDTYGDWAVPWDVWKAGNA